MKGVILLLCGVVLLMPSSIEFGADPVPDSDKVSKAFDTYEQLWRDSAALAAEQLDTGELTTDEQTRDFLSTAGQAARRTAFADIAAAEEESYWTTDEHGERVRQSWTAEKHASILRAYVQ